MMQGGGQALYDEMYARFNLKPFLCGNSGPQWAGWFRNEINSVDDLHGLKFRTDGPRLGDVLANSAWRCRRWAGRRMFQALQSGALDAGEFIGPWSDSALGLQQVAKNYYWPGVGEPSSAEECGINADVYNELPDDLKEAVALCLREPLQPGAGPSTHQARARLRELVAEHGRDGAQAAATT